MCVPRGPLDAAGKDDREGANADGCLTDDRGQTEWSTVLSGSLHSLRLSRAGETPTHGAVPEHSSSGTATTPGIADLDVAEATN